MTRTLHFRAWDKDTKRMFTVQELHWDTAGRLIAIIVNGNEHTSEPYAARRLTPKEIELLQRTGQNDQHGAPIFEGDDIRYIGPNGKEVISNRKIVEWTGTGFNFKSGENFQIAGNKYEGSQE